MPVPVPSGRPSISFPFAVPRDFFQLKGQLEAALEQSRPCGHRGHEGAKAVASALARLTELKELELNLDGNKIGPGPRRAVCSDPAQFEARELQLLGTAYHGALSLNDPGAERCSLGLTSLSPEVMQAPQLWLRACAICSSSRGSELGCLASRSVKQPCRPCPTNHVQAIQALDP